MSLRLEVHVASICPASHLIEYHCTRRITSYDTLYRAMNILAWIAGVFLVSAGGMGIVAARTTPLVSSATTSRTMNRRTVEVTVGMDACRKNIQAGDSDQQQRSRDAGPSTVTVPAPYARRILDVDSDRAASGTWWCVVCLN